MTKQRAPLTFERAIVRIADLLGFETMGRLIGRSARTVMDYSDPDTTTGITLRDAFMLEEAYALAGGDGAPISDCWRTRLKLSLQSSGDGTLEQHLVTIIKESAEATAAVAIATRTGATALDRAIARRELEEAISAKSATLAHLSEGTGPEGGERPVPGGTS